MPWARRPRLLWLLWGVGAASGHPEAHSPVEVTVKAIKCYLPDDTHGYDVSGCNTSSAPLPARFCSLACAEGFRWQEPRLAFYQRGWGTCSSPGGTFQLPGRCVPETAATKRTLEVQGSQMSWQVPAEPIASFRHEENSVVDSLAITTSGTLAFTSGADATIKVWNMGTLSPRPVASFMHGLGRDVHIIAVAADKAIVASGSHGLGANDDTVHVWDLRENWLQRPLATIPLQARLTSLAVSPDGCFVISAMHRAGASEILGWHVPNGTAFFRLRPPGGSEVTALAITPDGSWAVSGDTSGFIYLWDLAANATAPTARFFHGEPISRIVVVNGARAFSSGVRLLKSWDLLTRIGSATARMDLGGALRETQNLAVTPDGVWLLRCGKDELAVAEFRSEGARLALQIPHSGFGCASVAVTPDGAHALTGGMDGIVRVWDLQLRSTVPSNKYYAACSPEMGVISENSKWMLSECAGSVFKVWDLHSRDLLPVRGEAVWGLRAPDFSPRDQEWREEGKKFQALAKTNEGERLILSSPDKSGNHTSVELWAFSMPMGNKPLQTVLVDHHVSKVTVSLDEQWLVTGGGREINAWHVHPTATVLHASIVVPGEQELRFLALTADGELLVAGTAHELFGWDFHACHSGTAELLWRFAAPVGVELLSWELLPDAAWVAAGGSDGRVYVWSLRRIDPAPAMLFLHGSPVSTLAPTPDSAWLLSGCQGGIVHQWDLRSHARVVARPAAQFGLDGRLKWARVMPDGAWMLCGITGGYIFMWPLFHTARYNGELMRSDLCREYDCHDRAITLPSANAGRHAPSHHVSLPSWLDLTTLRRIELQGAVLDCRILPPLPWTTLMVNLSQARVETGHLHTVPMSWFTIYGRVLDLRGMMDIAIPQVSGQGVRKRSVSACHVDFEVSEVCIRRSDEAPVLRGTKTCANSFVSLKRVDWHTPTPLVTTYVDVDTYDFWLCDCVAGYFGNGSSCSECPEDWYCPDPGPTDVAQNLDKAACPPQSGTDARPGCATLGQCVCEPGYEQQHGNDEEGHQCIPCPVGTFSDSYANEACTACGFGFTPGVARSECVVNLQYFLLLGCFFIQLVIFFRLLLLALGLPLPLEDVSLIDGQVILLVTGSHYVQKQALARISVRGSGHPALDCPEQALYVTRISGRRLLLTDEKGQPVPTAMDSSQGSLHIRFPHTVLHTGCGCLPTALILTFLVAVMASVAMAIRSACTQESEARAAASMLGFAVLITMIDHWRRQKALLKTPLWRSLTAFRTKLREKGQANPCHCERGAARAVTAGQVTDLIEHFQAFFRDTRDMYYLASNVIKPLTQQEQVSYAELVGPQEVEWFCSHFWGTPFKHFTESLKKHALAVAWRECRDWRSIPYYICSFSNNQWDLNQELPGDWQESSFYLALRSGRCRGTTMIVDEAVLPLTRSWCLFEVLQTLILSYDNKENPSFEGLLLCTSTGVLNYGEARMDISMAIAQKLATLDLRDAVASRPSDKKMIDDLVVSLYRGFDEVNSFVRHQIRDSLLRMRKRFDVDFRRLDAALQPSSACLASSPASSSAPTGQPGTPGQPAHPFGGAQALEDPRSASI